MFGHSCPGRSKGGIYTEIYWHYYPDIFTDGEISNFNEIDLDNADYEGNQNYFFYEALWVASIIKPRIFMT